MIKKKESESLSNLLSNPIVMGLGAIMMVPDLIPVLIGAFMGFIISKSKNKGSHAPENEKV